MLAYNVVYIIDSLLRIIIYMQLVQYILYSIRYIQYYMYFYPTCCLYALYILHAISYTRHTIYSVQPTTFNLAYSITCIQSMYTTAHLLHCTFYMLHTSISYSIYHQLFTSCSKIHATFCLAIMYIYYILHFTFYILPVHTSISYSIVPPALCM